jgi:putative PIN family toxin of toxin-antitoxin system
MNVEPRSAFDSNVLVSAALFEESIPGQAFHLALSRGQVLISDPLIDELREVLRRKKFDPYLPREVRDRFCALLVERATLVVVTETIRARRDPKDDIVLELAVSGHATHIVTGDPDLLAPHPFRAIAVLTPRAFVEEMTAMGESP